MFSLGPGYCGVWLGILPYAIILVKNKICRKIFSDIFPVLRFLKMGLFHWQEFLQRSAAAAKKV
jgi:hypothetical protein